ncbi:hypothetical protein O3M35_009128 [Rhynocoris fuscipes]|uniref:Uncharacterized protein n=1 Tax=Rhynocoris fuscipes TaxID=488301 RepID=A0AAW1D358_9HEMI
MCTRKSCVGHHRFFKHKLSKVRNLTFSLNVYSQRSHNTFKFICSYVNRMRHVSF